MKKNRFRPMKKLFVVCFLILFFYIIPQHAVAAITDNNPQIDPPEIYDFLSLADQCLVATVTCQVYHDYQSGPYVDKFVYTYQITNTSTAGISFFSVDILGADEPESAAWEPIAGCIDPSYWDVTASPPSVEGIFGDKIDDGESSSLLYFVSDNQPGLGRGMLVGMDAATGYVNATGDLTVPVPEPTALILLGGGWLIAITRRKRSH